MRQPLANQGVLMLRHTGLAYLYRLGLVSSPFGYMGQDKDSVPKRANILSASQSSTSLFTDNSKHASSHRVVVKIVKKKRVINGSITNCIQLVC